MTSLPVYGGREDWPSRIESHREEVQREQFEVTLGTKAKGFVRLHQFSIIMLCVGEGRALEQGPCFKD